MTAGGAESTSASQWEGERKTERQRERGRRRKVTLLPWSQQAPEPPSASGQKANGNTGPGAQPGEHVCPDTPPCLFQPLSPQLQLDPPSQHRIQWGSLCSGSLWSSHHPTYTYTHAHVYTHIHMHMHAHICSYTQMHVDHMHTHVHMYTHVYIHAYTRAHAQIHTHYIYAHAHVCVYTHVHVYCIHTRINIHTQIHIPSYTYTTPYTQVLVCRLPHMPQRAVRSPRCA